MNDDVPVSRPPHPAGNRGITQKGSLHDPLCSIRVYKWWEGGGQGKGVGVRGGRRRGWFWKEERRW